MLEIFLKVYDYPCPEGTRYINNEGTENRKLQKEKCQGTQA